MENLIFGRSWEEIQLMQGGITRAVNLGPKPEATAGDRKLLQEFGESGLLEKGFHGVIDRLRTSGLV